MWDTNKVAEWLSLLDGLLNDQNCLQAMLEMLNGGEPMLEARSSREDISERPSWDGLAETHGEASSEMAEAVAGAMTGVDGSEPSRAALSRGPLSRSGSCLTCSNCKDQINDSIWRHGQPCALRMVSQRRKMLAGHNRSWDGCPLGASIPATWCSHIHNNSLHHWWLRPSFRISRW